MANRLAVDGCSPIYWPLREPWRQDQSLPPQPSDDPLHLAELKRSETKKITKLVCNLNNTIRHVRKFN